MTITEHLSQEEITPLHEHLLKLVRGNLKASRGVMAKFYPLWDAAAIAYKRKLDLSPKTVEDKARGLPEKIYSPLAFAQIQTAIAFSFLILQQKDVMFEFTGVEGVDDNITHCSETLVQRDWDSSQGDTVLLEFLRNTFRFGMGVTTESWVKEITHVPVTETTPDTQVLGKSSGPGITITKYKPVVRFEGNRIRNISPYKFFPDPGVHINNWRNGSFVCIEDEYTKGRLERMEANKEVYGAVYVKNITMDAYRNEGRMDVSRFIGVQPGNEQSQTVYVSEYYTWLVPSKTKAENDRETLGTEDVPILYVIWMANDQRIIKCEPLNCVHNQWPISVGFFAPDQHDGEMGSMTSITEDLQKIHSWLINSRVAAVTRTVNAQVIASPLMVDISTIENGHRLIKTTKSGAMRPIDQFFQQLPVQDTTQGHFQDMAVVDGFVQKVTGVNENMMGIVSGGRRSATEMRNVTGGSSARMKLVVKCLWTNALVPMANRLRTNHRQAISPEHFQIVCGQKAFQNYFQQFRSTPDQLAAEYDFITHDGTLPSEKSFTAQQFQDVLVMLLSNPEAALQFRIDPNKLFRKVCRLRGLGDLVDVEMDEQQYMQAQQQYSLQLQLQAQAKQAGRPTSTSNT